MATTSPINGLPTPDDNSPNDPPIHFLALNNQLDTRLVPRFATATARNNAITTPVEGMVCAVAGDLQVYRSGSWSGVYPVGERVWSNISMTNGSVADSSTPQAMVSGGMIYTRGLLTTASGLLWNSPFATLPAGKRPATNLLGVIAWGSVAGQDTWIRLDFINDGTIHAISSGVQAAVSGSFKVSLSGVSVPA